MIRELRAAKSGLIQLVALNHRSHRAVDDQDSLLQCFQKFRHKQKTPRARGPSSRRTGRTLAGSLAFFILVASGPQITPGAEDCTTGADAESSGGLRGSMPRNRRRTSGAESALRIR